MVLFEGKRGCSAEGGALTARYCGVRPPRPVRLPQVVALLSCCICWASCCCRRRCSLSFCVSANFTTMGDEQPWRGGDRKKKTGEGKKGEGGFRSEIEQKKNQVEARKQMREKKGRGWK